MIYMPSASRNNEFARPCQPLPFVFKASKTSASNRIVTCFLVGDFCKPRTRFILLKSASVSGWLSGSVRDAAVIAASSFGVGCIILRISFPFIKYTFTFVCFSKTYNTALIPAIRKNTIINSILYQPKSNISYFIIVVPIVNKDNCGIPIKVMNHGKINATAFLVLLCFFNIPFVFHYHIVATIKKAHKENKV